MPNFYDNFEIWSNQTNAMHQYAIWTALATKASVLHYNIIIQSLTKQLQMNLAFLKHGN